MQTASFQPALGTPQGVLSQTHAAQFRKEGADWFAIFNLNTPPSLSSNFPPQLERRLDVDLVRTLSHDRVVCSIRFSPDGNILATGSNHATRLYNVSTGEQIYVLVDGSLPQSEDLYIRGLTFSPDGRYLATGADDGIVRIWSTQTCTLYKRLSGHEKEIYALEYSPDGRMLVSGSGDNTVRVWDMEYMDTNTDVRVSVTDVPGEADQRCATSVAISPNSKFIAVGTLDGIIRIWDIELRTLVTQLEGHIDSVYSVAFAQGGRELISGSLDNTVKRWDMTPLLHHHQHERVGPCNCIGTYAGHEDYVLCVAVTHDLNQPERIISSSRDRTVKFWDTTRTDTGAPNPEFTLKGHKNSVIGVDASPTGGIFATAGGDWDAKIWRYTTLS